MPSPKKRYVLLKLVNVTLLEKMVFADAVKLKDSRGGHSGLSWAISPMICFSVRVRRE